jgi:glyoxylase-like metal-dependent hydrolase (beta-lactamase superfamily II)
MAKVTGYDVAGLHDLVEQKLMPRIDLRFLPGLGSYALKDIEEISRDELQAIPAPGHSPGHYCLYAPATRTVFAGDLGMDSFGPWYGFPHCNLKEYVASIEKVRALQPKRVLSSHGPVILENPDQAFARCLEVIESRHAKLMAAWTEGTRGLQELADLGIFYDNLARLGRSLIPVVSYWQQNMALCHLDYAGLVPS